MKNINLIFLLVILFFGCELKAAINPVVPDTTVARLMNSFQYRDAANIINARLRKANRLNTDERLYYNNQLSAAYFRLRMIDSAMIVARKSIHLSVLSADSALIADAWKMMSYSFNHKGKLDSALVFNKKIIDYAERNGDKRLMRNSMTFVGTIMNQNRRPSDALNYFKKAFLLTKEIGDNASYASTLYNIGFTYVEFNKPDSALIYLKESLNLSLAQKQFDLSLWTYISTADAYMQLNDFPKWKQNTLELYNLAEKMQNNEFIAHAYNRLLRGLTKKGDYKEAIFYGNKALDILKTHSFPSLQISVDSSMFAANEAVGNYKESLKYLKSFYRENASMLNENQRTQLNELETRFSVKEKDLTITQQKLELTHKQKNIQILLFILILFILIVAVSIVNVIRNHRFRRELYKKEKYLDKQLADTKQWMEGVFLKDSFVPTVFKQLPYSGESNPIEQDLLSPQSILYSELRTTIEKQKLYLNPELNLEMVVKLLGTNKKYLYQAISSNTDDNFRNFINRYRIDHAKQLIEEDVRSKSNSNLSELFHLCGFSNVSSFFRTFKSITGLTPREYATEVERDLNS